MSAARGRRFGSAVGGLWLAVGLTVIAIAWQLHRAPGWNAAGAPVPFVEDRRQHHFRNLTYGQTEDLLQRWLRKAFGATSPRERALLLARVAMLQRERGLDDAARAAAREALDISKNDPEVRELLSRRLRPDELLP